METLFMYFPVWLYLHDWTTYRWFKLCLSHEKYIKTGLSMILLWEKKKSSPKLLKRPTDQSCFQVDKNLVNREPECTHFNTLVPIVIYQLCPFGLIGTQDDTKVPLSNRNSYWKNSQRQVCTNGVKTCILGCSL